MPRTAEREEVEGTAGTNALVLVKRKAAAAAMDTDNLIILYCMYIYVWGYLQWS